MNTPFSRKSSRPLLGALAALLIVPTLPVKAEGPIDHLQKRRAQIHNKVGQFFERLGRKIENAADHVEYRTAPSPPPPVYYRDDRPYIEDEDRVEFELRYGRGTPGRTFPDGSPYPDNPSYREDWRYREQPLPPSSRGRDYRIPSEGPDHYTYEEDYAEPGLRAPYRTMPAPSQASRQESMPKRTQPAPEKQVKPAPMPESKASPSASDSKSFDDSSSLRYGRPVPGKQGFVYPPGVKEEAKNMIDVRDFQPGQKVKDPRSGEIFLVP